MMKNKLALAGVVTLAMSAPVWAADQPTRLSYDYRASDVMGEEVENANDENIGEIDDLVISGDDKVLYAVISVGGFLGIGDKLVTVPFNELQITSDEDGEPQVTYNATKEQLEAQPEFNYKEGEMTWKSQREEEREEMREELSEERQDVQEERQDVTEAKKEAQESVAEAKQEAQEAIQEEQQDVEEEQQDVQQVKKDKTSG